VKVQKDTQRQLWRRGPSLLLSIFALIILFTATVFVSVRIALQDDQLTFLRYESSAPVEAKRDEEPFPVSVNPLTKTIFEDPSIDVFIREHLANLPRAHSAPSKFTGNLLAVLLRSDLYQNLASPSSRTLVILSGERKEEIIKNFGDILKWDTAGRASFLTAISSSSPLMSEGKFYPGKYIVPKGALPDAVSPLVLERFENEVLARYDASVEALVPLADALTIASLLEREAYDFEDMRTISGVIWNRLFINMPLQLDATLQYAKGSQPTEPWWPRVLPRDKFIESPFNTYENEGLPPAPIANPSVDAILAALNPKKTECLYYFHDKKGGFHCSPTYDGHVELLRQHYGRGS
jgi:cell division protein YceG involved in septum cleavage